MRALKTFKDDFGVVRKNGEEWLIKMSDTETHIPNVYEEVSFADLCVKTDQCRLMCSVVCKVPALLSMSSILT